MGWIPEYYHKRPIVENCAKISVSSFVRKVLIDLNKLSGRMPTDLSKEESVREFVRYINSRPSAFIAEINNPENRSENQTLRLTYTPSNLRRGFIFWFVCSGCGRKARHLYATPHCHILMCRRCHRLNYKSQNASRDREVAHLIRNPDLMTWYARSNNLKKQLKVLKAEIMIEEARKSIRKEVENFDK